MQSPRELEQQGLLPVVNKPVRFAVGDPNGVTSNSWKIWAHNKSELYLSCRDNFKETKVSLHASGRWQMGFTDAAVAKNPRLLQSGESRHWSVWDKPQETLPDTIVAFHLYFLTTELTVLHEHRVGKIWKKDLVHFIEAGPPGKMTMVSLFVTRRGNILKSSAHPYFLLARYDMPDDRCVHVIAHADDEGTIPKLVAESRNNVRRQAFERGVQLPINSYSYFFGHRGNGARFIVGARVWETGPGSTAS